MRDLPSLQPTQCEGDVCAPTLSRGAATPRLFAACPPRSSLMCHLDALWQCIAYFLRVAVLLHVLERRPRLQTKALRDRHRALATQRVVAVRTGAAASLRPCRFECSTAA